MPPAGIPRSQPARRPRTGRECRRKAPTSRRSAEQASPILFSWVSAASLSLGFTNHHSLPSAAHRVPRLSQLPALYSQPHPTDSRHSSHVRLRRLSHHNLNQASHPEGNVLRWCALSPPLPSSVMGGSNSEVPARSLHHTTGHTCVLGRLAEGEDTVIFARVDEAEKCEFIKANASEEAWASTDDGAGLLIKASALREQAREVLVRSSEPLDRLTDRGRD